MKEIFVNLKRFDVPRIKGGVCTEDTPKVWVEKIIDESIELGLGQLKDLMVVYMVPEGLLLTACERLMTYNEACRRTLAVGVQGIYREDIAVGGNFGAFTTHLPATAAVGLGAKGTLIGHCEERKDKENIIGCYEPDWQEDETKVEKVLGAVDRLLNEELKAAFKQSLNVVFCVGETAKQRGVGELEVVKENVKRVLRSQLERGLKEVNSVKGEAQLCIAYEPIWAIGPGKTPPDEVYITFVSSYIKEVVKELYGFEPVVVYGGGLKEENARMIGSIESIDGGLVALTRFSGEIGFYTEELRNIINQYIG